MTITLYKVNNDPTCIDKITGVTPTGSNISVYPLHSVNMLYPVFDIDLDNTYMCCNYLYCDTFDRYYFIKNISINTAQHMIIQCAIDVLQSFKNSILNSPTTILRAESIGYPTQIIDTKLPINPTRKQITSIVLPETSNTFDTDAEYSYLLTVIGGQPSI